MEITYKILATDGKEYGPATLAEITQWMGEGRIGPDTQLLRSDQSSWSPASSFSELGLAAASAAPPPLNPARHSQEQSAARVAALTQADSQRDQAVKSGADWFFWIAGLSLINTFVGRGGFFLFGMGLPLFVDGRLQGMESGATLATVINMVILALMVGCGIFARKKYSWAFIAGMALYTVDLAVIWLHYTNWLGIGCHGFALYSIYQGFQASRESV